MTAKSVNEQMADYSFAWMWDELGDRRPSLLGQAGSTLIVANTT